MQRKNADTDQGVRAASSLDRCNEEVTLLRSQPENVKPVGRPGTIGSEFNTKRQSVLERARSAKVLVVILMRLGDRTYAFAKEHNRGMALRTITVRALTVTSAISRGSEEGSRHSRKAYP